MTTPSPLETHYRSVSESGRRPEGVWYSAVSLDGVPVSVVALSPTISAKASNDTAFFGQLQRASALKIPGVARPVSWGRTAGGILHCAYAREGELMDLAVGQKPPAEVARVGLHAARVLAAVHQAGLLHGAISPTRFQRAGDGLQVSALGLYSALSAGGLGENSAAMLLSGLAYLSPEVRAAAPMDARSDVYSLGATLYELITGKPPFGGRTTSFVMASVLSESEASEAIPGEGDSVVATVLRAIESVPEDRWPSAKAFAQALDVGAGLPEEKGRSLFDIFKGAWFSARRSRE